MKRPNPRKTFVLFARAASLCLLLWSAGAASGQGLPREKGAFYLEDFFHQPYRLQVLVDAPIYFNADAARFLGTLRRGQVVEMQAVTEHAPGMLRVRGQAQQGQVAGWVPERYLTTLDPSFVEGLRKAADRRDLVKTLAASGEIALNMTPEEVSGILGQPAKKSSHTDVGGTSESWEFVRYEQVPRQVITTDALGRAVVSVVYEKVAVGSFTITFTGGLARAIDQSDKAGVSVANTLPVKTVPPPVVFHF